MKRALLLAAVLLALGAPGAKAAPFTPAMNRAYNAAIIYWSGPPPDCSSIDREIVPNDVLPGAAGLATQPPPGEQIPCVLYISRWLAKPLEWGSLCMIMVHEVGHLHGLGHSEDPESIMYPEPDKLPGVCLRLLDRETRWAGT